MQDATDFKVFLKRFMLTVYYKDVSNISTLYCICFFSIRIVLVYALYIIYIRCTQYTKEFAFESVPQYTLSFFNKELINLRSFYYYYLLKNVFQETFLFTSRPN